LIQAALEGLEASSLTEDKLRPLLGPVLSSIDEVRSKVLEVETETWREVDEMRREARSFLTVQDLLPSRSPPQQEQKEGGGKRRKEGGEEIFEWKEGKEEEEEEELKGKVLHRFMSLYASYPQKHHLLQTKEWRALLDEVSSNLRREIQEKIDHEHLMAYAHKQVYQPLLRRLDDMGQEVVTKDSLVEETGFCELQEQVDMLKLKATKGCGIQGRWLWRSGKTVSLTFPSSRSRSRSRREGSSLISIEEGLIPWEIQSMNDNGASLQWEKGATHIGCEVPGMYHLTLGIFSSAPVSLTILANDEPILNLSPSPSHTHFLSSTPSDREFGSTLPSNQPLLIRSDTQHYTLHRKSHSFGDVTSISLSEYIALPPATSLSVRVSSGARCQGFLSLAKL
jgi:hypothetical protein